MCMLCFAPRDPAPCGAIGATAVPPPALDAPLPYTETTDVVGSTATKATLEIGQSAAGALTRYDQDWFRVSLEAGETYTFAVAGNGALAIGDSTLTLRGASGATVVSVNNVVGSLHPTITFTATSTGTYFLDVGGYSTATGGYQLSTSVQAPLPALTDGMIDDVRDHIREGFWADYYEAPRTWANVETTPITYSTYGLNSSNAALARRAFATWQETTGIRFQETTPTAARIRFQDDEDMTAWCSTTLVGTTVTSALINVGPRWLTTQGQPYTLQTYIHEIGHAHGLGHAGTYNGWANFGPESLTADSWQASIMSYFDQDENPNIAATRAWLLTPMIADLEAIRQMYGELGTLRGGNDSYGTTTTAGGAYTTFASWLRSPSGVGYAVTIVDEGGIDTLNLSAARSSVTLDLGPGRASSAGGEVGNIIIGRGTLIENATGSAYADRITGNDVANVLNGGGGDDRIVAGLGDDTLDGGTGIDTLTGGEGNDVYVTTLGDVVVELAEGGIDTQRTAATMTLAANVENLLLLGSYSIGGTGNELDNLLTGNAGSNKLFGGLGNDTLTGLGGNDRLEGDEGDDVLTGGTGYDTFVFEAGSDRITDFVNNVDTIAIARAICGGLSATVASVLERCEIVGTDAVFTLDGGAQLTVAGVTNRTIFSDDLILI